MGVATLGDVALASSVTGTVLRGHQSQVGHHLARMTKAMRFSCFCLGSDTRGATKTLLSDDATGADHPPHQSAPGTNPGSLRRSHRECKPVSVPRPLKVAPACAHRAGRS